MFRTTFIRTIRPSLRPCIRRAAATGRPLLVAAVRFNSSQQSPPSSNQVDKAALKAARERNDELQKDWNAEIISYNQVKRISRAPTPDTYLIDVREPDEVIQGMIPSAVNLPLSVLADSLYLHHDAFKAKHGFEKPQRDQRVIFYCRSGVRSSTACDVAKRNGYTKILNYKGSWLEWVENGSKKS
ncbi:hypothetical protein AMATHDRAFT_3710 [Amanita thiersii Skay4041]|uniref:Rhodanese domain-containing protein n=1 Tax=Amanita thiersii Skay4041 TaxID=703135 RepID=A0A2A9NR61_9AGAR|nr:hypothetical protein AMATHDRAFT_3710 [Amanita thiersii Skay4041]